MEQNTTQQPQSGQRDYDKDPIVIEDYNPVFKVLMVLVASLWFIDFFIHPLKLASHSHSFWASHFFGFVFIPTISFYFYLRRVKRKIVIENNVITYREGVEVLETISLNEISDIRRTFNDYYRIGQNVNPDYTIRILLGRLISPIEYFILLINKILFHLVKNGLSAYKLFDAILVIADDGRVINILPTNNREYETVQSYFLEKKSIDIKNVNTLIKFDYIEEEKAK
jgi:hypothetical protein